MGYGIAIEEAGEIELYRFGRSKQVYRGPQPDLRQPYYAFIGGSEPFGKFVLEPFPQLVEKATGITCANWGSPGAGPGFFLKDPVILEACSEAEICVVQVMDPVALSNRMYSVFPRRNLRLHSVSETMKQLYPDVDFGKFKYVPAMLRKLQEVDSKAYVVVEREQQSAWLSRMLELLQDIETDKLLLWLQPECTDAQCRIVSDDMMEIVGKHATRLIKVTVPIRTRRELLFGGPIKESGWMTKDVHELVAGAVINGIREIEESKRPVSIDEPFEEKLTGT